MLSTTGVRSVMKSPTTADEKLMKEFEIDESMDLEPVFKLGYVRTQIDEFKKVIYRNRVDAIISLDMIERAEASKDERLAQKGRENLANYREVIRQMAGAVKLMEQLKNELEPLVASTVTEQ
jgi:hypothetical protein